MTIRHVYLYFDKYNGELPILTIEHYICMENNLK